VRAAASPCVLVFVRVLVLVLGFGLAGLRTSEETVGIAHKGVTGSCDALDVGAGIGRADVWQWVDGTQGVNDGCLT
jgi:hypothetical protein